MENNKVKEATEIIKSMMNETELREFIDLLETMIIKEKEYLLTDEEIDMQLEEIKEYKEEQEIKERIKEIRKYHFNK